MLNLPEGMSLMDLAKKHKNEYKKALPFPFLCLEDFFKESLLEAIESEFPDLQTIKGGLHHSGTTDEKFASPRGDIYQQNNTKKLLSFLNGSEFIDFLQELTSIKEPLIPDPHFIGGGLHQNKPGGFLKVHVDFSKHPETKLDRRVNVLVYLNKKWKEEYGGHLTLFDKEMKECHHKILPTFNKIVIFNTTDFTYHGVPDPLNCPKNRTRKSLALYYFSNGRPSNEVRSLLENQSTIYKTRPGEKFNYNVKYFISLLIPPIALPALRFCKKIINRNK